MKKKIPLSGNQIVLIAALAAITVVFSLINPNFFSLTNLINILISFVVLLAVNLLEKNNSSTTKAKGGR